VPAPTEPTLKTSGRELLVALFTVARRLKSQAHDQGLDTASALVLHHVRASGPLRVSALARHIGLDSSTVSRHVAHLERAGYLSRSGDPDDRRASRLGLTERGHALLEEAMEARAAIVDQAVADWTEEDRRTLTELMTRLATSLDRPTDDQEAG
jgi:DNA-binding MarR family transcriptional regulator